MEDPTSIPVPESGELRRCPACGSRVADLATECLMCGAPLDVEEEPPPEEPSRPHLQVPWRGIIVSIVTVIAFVGAVWWLVRAQVASRSVTPTPAFTPTLTQPPTLPPEPTDTPTLTLSPTPIPPQVHQVQQGETCVSIAVQHEITLDQLVALNPEKCGPGGLIRPGDLLLIPAATPTPGPTPTVGPGTPLPTQECPIIHVVQAGETGIAIAERYGVSPDVIQRANGLDDLSQLQVNQSLQIPCGTPSPTPRPTVDPNASPTPIPRLMAAALLSPPDGATLTASMVPLQWTAVSLLGENEWYAVRVRRLDADVSLESLYVKTTLVRLGEEYAPSPDDPSREYSWQVTVVRLVSTSDSGQPRYTAISHPSVKRTFRWLASTPQAPLAATPSP